MDHAVYVCFRAAAWVIGLLPIRFVFRVGELLGSFAWHFSGAYGRLVVQNLRIAFGAEKSRELRRLGRRHFARLTANLLCSIKITGCTREEVLGLVAIDNADLDRLGCLGKQGIVGAIGHTANWELFAQVFPAMLPGAKTGTVYQRLGNRFIDAEVRARRERLGLGTFERKEGLKAAMRMLREAGIVGVLFDQHAGDGGVWCPFFGRLASTTSLPATMALKTGALLVPIFLYTEGVARWRLVVHEPLDLGSGSAAQITADLNEVLADAIRRSPEDWFWVHNRWKTPTPHFLLSRYKRGFALPSCSDAPKMKPFKIVIRSSNWLGDAVMSVPAVRAIKAGRPDAHVTVLTPAKLADMWKLVAEVDEVVSFRDGAGVFSVARKLRGNFEVAILFPNSTRAALEAWLAKIPRRVGYPGRWRSRLVDQIVPESTEPRAPEHQMNRFLRLAEAVGADISNWERFWTKPVLPPAAPAERMRLALCPGAEYGPAKRWLPDRFAIAARKISTQTSCEWMLVGTAKDQAVGKEIAEKLQDRCKNLIGRTSLAELIETLTGCRLVLTNDTGTMHLAALLGIPTVAIFGSTEHALTGPLGRGHTIVRRHVECSPCFLRECPIDFRCMNEVTIEDVVAAVLQALGGNAEAPSGREAALPLVRTT